MVTLDTHGIDRHASPADAALDYARRGFRVVPLYGIEHDTYAEVACECNREACGSSAGKHPRITAWQRHATDDAATVARWFRRWPSSNVGLAMGGAHRLVALDVDGDAGARTLARLAAELGQLPDTLTSRSGRAAGGHHRVFVLPAAHDLRAVRNRAGGLGEGLDVRAEGGQIVAAPSLHYSGGRYRWIDCRAPVELPERWCARVTGADLPMPATAPTRLHVGPSTRPAAYARAVLARACTELAGAPRGTRNDTAARLAFSVGGYLWTSAYTLDGAHADLLAATRAAGWDRDRDGLTATTLRRQLAAGGAKPRSIPEMHVRA